MRGKEREIEQEREREGGEREKQNMGEKGTNNFDGKWYSKQGSTVEWVCDQE